MYRENLKQIIKSTLSKDVKIADIPMGIVKNSYLIEYYLNTVSISENDMNDFINSIKQVDEMKEFNGTKWMIVGDTGLSLDYKTISNWILSQSIIYGIDNTIDRLHRFLELKGMPLTEILAFCGFSISKEIELADGYSFVPFDEVHIQKSFAFDTLAGIQTHYMGVVQNSFFITPTVVLKRNYLHKYKMEDSTAVLQTNQSFKNEMEDIILSLNLIESLATTSIAHWFQVDDWVPCSKNPTGLQGAGDSISGHSSGWYIYEDIKKIVSEYMSLDKNLKEKLRIPLKRINLAKKKNSFVDKSIDLRIAFESLLIDNKDGDASISHLIKIRGCYLYSCDTKVREEITRKISKIYGVCSRAVHTGKIEKKSDEELINEGIRIIIIIVKKIIEIRKIPDWNKMLLSCIVD